MTEQEIKERGEQEAWDNHQADLCILEIDMREVVMKWFDKYCGERFWSLPVSRTVRGTDILDAHGLTFVDYTRWKNPPPPSSDLPF